MHVYVSQVVHNAQRNLIKTIYTTYHCPTTAINNHIDVPNLKT